MEWKLELVPIPVSDVDRAKAFYTQKVGFDVDLDHSVSEEFRVVQLTPPGSACSIAFGIGFLDTWGNAPHLPRRQVATGRVPAQTALPEGRVRVGSRFW